MINVTKTFLPNQQEYQNILKRAWDKNWMTNRGELVKELELKISNLLKTNYVLAMTNGTLPIQIALKALDLKGEVITTPFSYVATTSSIVWEGATPVFVDIDPEYLTIDERQIEKAITKQTTAILATHVYGNPCHVEEIKRIADCYNLAVIYDGAHCFGIEYKGQSLFNYGDVTTCSFHATKVFHTGEGGAAFCNSKSVYDKIYYHHNFGHASIESFKGLGTNAKMSELQAAMGLAVLPYFDEIVDNRRKITDYYDAKLDFSKYQKPKWRDGATHNYSYYPIVFDSESELLKHYNKLMDNHIYARRYFYPSLETLPYVKSNNCSVASDIAKRILCLPLYPDLQLKDQNQIIKNLT